MPSIQINFHLYAYTGQQRSYPSPIAHYENHCNCDICKGKREKHLGGVAGLEQGNAMTIEPADLARFRRSHEKK